MKSKSLLVLILLVLIVYSGCQSSNNSNGEPPVENNYVEFTQAVRGLITGTTDINGTLTLKQGSTAGTDVTVSNGTFSIAKGHQLETGTYEVTLITNEGITLQVSDAQLDQSSLYLPRTKRLIDNVIEKSEALTNYVSSADSQLQPELEQMILNWSNYARTEILPQKKKCLERLEKKLMAETSAADINRLGNTRERLRSDINRIEAEEYTLCDAYKDCTFPSSEIWFKKPTIVIYDQSVWRFFDHQWTQRPELKGWLHHPDFLIHIEYYYTYFAYNFFDGLTDAPFDVLIESKGHQMPDPNAPISSNDDTRYIFFVFHDDVEIQNRLGGIEGRYDSTNGEVTKSLATIPYNMDYDIYNLNLVIETIFYSLRVARDFFPSVPFVDNIGNPSAIMKLVGKIKNHRDPHHILDFANGEYIDKYGSYSN